ncbi:TlpA disulfide reductase family protein [Xylophilus sp. GOD-11R]|uniref:TlpA family protein disulfide reductase n=1 Tax=Xylophilus sp. GOD-11R TaxID=3089814 RepID=UPI00298CE94F|nr:TlpA disulfide reductase family protein [Xylophilus sp. GOD-11R]WPB57639.1 TlpA disulfide reductase family protein [Xylophilus sp. GOD-11R]
MSDAVTLGPLVLPTGFVLLVVAVVAALLGNGLATRRGAADAERQIMVGLVLGLLCARVVFVWQFRAEYQDSPLGVLDIRDGGWNPQAGFFAAWAWGLARQLSRPQWRRGIWAGLGAASAVWIAGSFALLVAAGPPRELPAFSLQSTAGAPVSLEAFRGKPVVVNLWATWCPPCQAEMPVLQAAQARRRDIHFVFLNQGESSGTVAEFMARRRLVLDNVLLDSRSEAGKRFDGEALPTTLFFDASGRLVDRHLGLLSQATLERYLQKLR